MKITISHNNSKGQQVVKSLSVELLLQRVTADDVNKRMVARFREAVPYLDLGYSYYKDIARWWYVYPAADFVTDDNGNMVVKRCNGLLLYKFCNIAKERIEEMKRLVAMLPSTAMALRSADDKGLVVLVKYAGREGGVPDDEQRAETLYGVAYRQMLPVYRSLVNADVEAGRPSLRNSFMMTFDEAPYYNAAAVAVRVDDTLTVGVEIAADLSQLEDSANADEDDNDSVSATITAMMRLLRERYDFRYNTVMKYVEYLSKEKGWYGFQPVDPRVLKRMTLEVQLADIRASIRDVRNFLESDYIQDYNPIDEYLCGCDGKWDGNDHIRALARTVPTDNPYWQDWFYIWFLGMVDQWRGGDRRQYGNSVAPLLISRQGYNKSTFCRRLLPPELQWGYNDNLVLSEKRQVLQAMAQFLLVSLDEFNQISPNVQQGFLKNLMQLPTLKIKRPYGSHVEEFPRLASFIATSNMTDILTDPSGNRRFIGVELTGPIDVSVRPNYRQLYSQALAALRKGEKCYFDTAHVELIMRNNCKFEVEQPIEQFFRVYFEPVENENDGEWLAAAEIFEMLKARYGSSIKVNTLMAFGRKLANMPGLRHKRFTSGYKYLVREI